MNRLFRHLFTISAIVIVASSCDNDFDFESKRRTEFGNGFSNLYGTAASTQNWNTLTQTNISISVASGTWEADILTADPETTPEKSFRVGHLINVSGSTSLIVDLPYTVKQVYVVLSNTSGSCIKATSVIDDKAEINFSNTEITALREIRKVDGLENLIIYEIADSVGHYDYNDIVLGVTHVSGEETAKIRLLAVGAIDRNIQISYNDGSETILFNNAHNALGSRKTNKVLNTIAGYHNEFEPAVYDNLKVGSNFSLTNNASNFVISVSDKKGKSLGSVSMWPDNPGYLGMAPYGILVANPTWEWPNEGSNIGLMNAAFKDWMKAERLYNTWWDNLWDSKDLINYGNSFQPNIDYKDLLFSYEDIQNNGGECPSIIYSELSKFKSYERGISLAFVVTDRNGESITFEVEKSNGAQFVWYPGNASVNVYGEGTNVDYGGGNAESCHVTISRKDIASIISQKLTLNVKFNKGISNTKLNSVWVKEQTN